MALSEKKQRFILEYLRDDNATKAAIRAGYSIKSAKALGSRLANEPEVAAEIERRREARAKRLEISADRVIKNLARIANFDLLSAVSFRGNKVVLRNSELLDDDDRYAIVSVSQGKDGITIKAADKLRANLELARLLGFGPKPDDGGDAEQSIADDDDPEVDDRGDAP